MYSIEILLVNSFPRELILKIYFILFRDERESLIEFYYVGEEHAGKKKRKEVEFGSHFQYINLNNKRRLKLKKKKGDVFSFNKNPLTMSKKKGK